MEHQQAEAALSNLSPGQLGLWLFALTAVVGLVYVILGVVVHIRTLREQRSGPSEEVPVTRRELAESIGQAIERLQKLETYTHQSVHDLRDGIHSLQLRVAALQAQIHEEVTEAIRPLEGKIERLTVSLTRVLAILEARGAIPPQHHKGADDE